MNSNLIHLAVVVLLLLIQRFSCSNHEIDRDGGPGAEENEDNGNAGDDGENGNGEFRYSSLLYIITSVKRKTLKVTTLL